MIALKIFVGIILINVIIILFAVIIASIKTLINNKLHSVSCFANYIGDNEYIMHINLSRFCRLEPDLIMYLKYIEDNLSFKITKISMQKLRNKNKVNDIIKSLTNVYYYNAEAIIDIINKLQNASYAETATILMYYKYNNNYKISDFEIIIDRFGPIVIEYPYEKDGEDI